MAWDYNRINLLNTVKCEISEVPTQGNTVSACSYVMFICNYRNEIIPKIGQDEASSQTCTVKADGNDDEYFFKVGTESSVLHIN